LTCDAGGAETGVDVCGATAAGTTGEGFAGTTGFGVGAAEPVVDPRSDKLKPSVECTEAPELKKVGCGVSVRLAEH